MAAQRTAFEEVVAASHLAGPESVPRIFADAARSLGATSAVIFLVDLDQRLLVPLAVDGRDVAEPFAVDGSVGGRCYRNTELLRVADEDGMETVWIPLLDDAERMGCLQMVFAAGAIHDLDAVVTLGGLIAQIIVAKSGYGDFFEAARRRRPITVSAELIWQLLPPLTFAAEGLVIAASFVPTHDLGGDAFDYGVDAQAAQVSIFDGMGHGLGAGLLATVAVAASRNTRRRGGTLTDAAAAIGAAIHEQFREGTFVTGVLLSLDRASGVVSWCSAGHPAPLIVRGGRAVKTLSPESGMPFGVGEASPVAHEQLEPGDRLLLYTDGVTESRTADGEQFGPERLVDLVARVGGGDGPPEMMRRLMHAVEEHNEGPMRDDATVVLVEWRGGGEAALQV